ncbi:MAG TPA: hypothetical protein VKW09_09115 [bacterium]|nr:hypothetical protein [bacterium]
MTGATDSTSCGSTLEVFLTKFPSGLRRRKDPATGLELLAFGPAADAA